ncbi:MAG TPA: gamma-glutamyl-gamma-aminobutyrate hydrolase family protein [Streptosporangiaceae bacterium]|jgi:putative glutamine amidotransferase
MRADEADGRPVIGISAYAEQARWGHWDRPTLLVPRSYADSVAAAGGIPVLLPPFPSVEQAAVRLDGLILSGGGDIDPAAFGAVPHPETGWIRPERDAAEFALLSAALGQGLPLLGICRGLQMLNVTLGGTLHQHLPDLVGHAGHAPLPGAYVPHQVAIAPGSKLAAILDRPHQGTEFSVPSYHHQAVDRLGDGLVASAWAEDGMIEAIEFAGQAEGTTENGTAGNGAAGHGFALAVQWHPEAGDDLRLFRALIAAARPGAQSVARAAARPGGRAGIPR